MTIHGSYTGPCIQDMTAFMSSATDSMGLGIFARVILVDYSKTNSL